jgi:hypothetical protein
MNKIRVLYLVKQFPQISETYIRSEIEAVSEECDVRVITFLEADAPYTGHAPYEQTDDPGRVWEVVDEFRPHVLHGHWLQQTRDLAYFAGCLGGRAGRPAIPFTVRAHSFDILDKDGKCVRESAPLLNHELCLGVLSFPFTRPMLENRRVRGDKVVDCYPVVNYRRFHDTSPNGDAVMNVGACLPKKKMEDFLALAASDPLAKTGRRYNLYALGYDSADFHERNARMGNPVTIVPPVEPEHMLTEYKKHCWLVYTACRKTNTVGWPLAVAECQAAGVGVCLPNLRPDLRDYLGGAGFLYDSINEVRDIIARPYPEEMRQAGFEQAKKSDVFRHKRLLLDLWRKAAGLHRGPGEDRRPPAGVAAWGEGESLLEHRLRVDRAQAELEAIVPRGATVVFADDPAQWDGARTVPGRRCLPFLERDGQFWGPPPDDDTAVVELERLRAEEAGFFILGWPVLWWLEHYPGLHRHLREHFRCPLENGRLVVFDLRQPATVADCT